MNLFSYVGTWTDTNIVQSMKQHLLGFYWLKWGKITFFTSGRTQTDILVKRSNLCLLHIDWSPETMIFDPF